MAARTWLFTQIFDHNTLLRKHRVAATGIDNRRNPKPSERGSTHYLGELGQGAEGRGRRQREAR